MDDRLFDNGFYVTRVPPGSDAAFGGSPPNPNADTRVGEWLGVIEQEAEERQQDEEWAEYLRREWEERNDEDGFRCDFAATALHKHGPCFVYRPHNEHGDLKLVDILDPVTRKSLLP